MSIIEFLEKVDELTAGCSQKQLSAVIHELARKWPEENREDFLKEFVKVINDGGTDNSEIKEKLLQEYQKLDVKLRAVDSGKWTLNAVVNEDYEYWRDDDENELLFQDEYGILETVKKLYNLMQEAFDYEDYQLAYLAAKRLIKLRIQCNGDYYEDEGLDIEALERETGLVSHQICCEMAMISCYLVNDEFEKRSDELYELIISDNRMPSLAELADNDYRELTDLKAFTAFWIIYLAEKQSEYNKATEMQLITCMKMLNDYDVFKQAALLSAEKYPVFPVQYLEKYSGPADVKNRLQLIRELMPLVSDKNCCGKLALLANGYCLKSGDNKSAQDYLLYNYQKTPSVTGLVRLMNESEDYGEILETIRKINDNLTVRRWDYIDDEEYMTLPYGQYQSVRILTGDYEVLLAENWQSDGKHDNLAEILLTILLLDETDSFVNKAGLSHLCYITGVNSSDYYYGKIDPTVKTEVELVAEAIIIWRNLFSLSEKEKFLMLNTAMKWIEYHTDYILRNNDRKKYGECAMLINLCAEVIGQIDTGVDPADYIRTYRNRYKRFSRFQSEMDGYQ